MGLSRSPYWTASPALLQKGGGCARTETKKLIWKGVGCVKFEVGM